ncbi:MAG TPA: ATP-binding protein [Vicinamibacterales bacterium]
MLTLAAALSRRWLASSGDERSTRATFMTLYVGGVIVAGSALLLQHVPRAYPQPWLAFLLLLAALILSVFKLRLPLGQNNSTMSMAYAVDFVALIMAGPDLAMVVAAAGVLMQCTVRVKKRQPLYRTAFSVASVTIAVHVCGWVWGVLGGDVHHEAPLYGLAVPLSAAAMTYFAVNTMLVAGAIGLSSGVSTLREWNREFFWSAPAYFLSAAVAAMVTLAITHGSYILLPLAASPLYLSYRAYRMSVGRIEEERRHAQELAGMIATTQQALARATESETALAAEKEQLALMSARLGVTLRTISDGVVTVDRSGAIILLNEGAQKLASVTPQEATERGLCMMLNGLGFRLEECRTALHRVLEDGTTVRLRNDTTDAGATDQRLVEVTATPTRDTDGQVGGAVWVLRDITDEALVEHERAKSARLESLGVLAGGLAHDFNNILMGVTGNLSLAQSMVSPDNKALLARLTNASAACARARGVTNQLLTFAKGGAPVKKTASIRELVTECTRFALSGSPVKPAFDVHPDLWAADVDTGQVGQVVQNLVLNAMQAMPKGGVLEVALHNIDLDAASIPADAPLVAGKYVRLSVRDTGTGIPAEVLNRIFDPYFSTKEKGSGLGLAISYSIVRAHGGAITVESEIDVGSCFTVYLPASPAVAAAQAAPRPEINMRRTGRVLIMDDEDMVAEVAQEMIESLGYTTRRACNGDEAIRMFNEAEQTGEPFDLVLLDLTVPGGMGGAEAVKYIREMRNDVCVLVNSGYADDSVLARYRDYGFDGVLAKPFTLTDLRRVLRELEEGIAETQQQGWPGYVEESLSA